jgi:hypothetical protein
VAGGRDVREGRRPRARRARLRALCEAVPRPAGTVARSAVPTCAHRARRRQRDARAGADEGSPARRPDRGRCAHEPHALPRGYGHARAGAAARRRVPQGRAGRAAEAPAEAEERQSR